MKFKSYVTLEIVCDATTLEDAKQQIDNAIDFSKLKESGLEVVGYDESIHPHTPPTDKSHQNKTFINFDSSET